MNLTQPELLAAMGENRKEIEALRVREQVVRDEYLKYEAANDLQSCDRLILTLRNFIGIRTQLFQLELRLKLQCSHHDAEGVPALYLDLHYGHDRCRLCGLWTKILFRPATMGPDSTVK